MFSKYSKDFNLITFLDILFSTEKRVLALEFILFYYRHIIILTYF